MFWVGWVSRKTLSVIVENNRGVSSLALRQGFIANGTSMLSTYNTLNGAEKELGLVVVGL